MPISFEHPVGSQADTKELEYVAALLQTARRLRPDATVETEDVAIYLRSRHGIDVDPAYIEDHLFPELGGNPHGPTNYIDLCQVVGIILIPYFLERERRDEPTHVNRFVFGRTMETILTDVIGSHRYEEGVEDGSLKLTKDLLLEILETYGETGVPDKVLDEMVEAAGGEGTALGADTLLKAIVSDVQLYDLSWQESATSHYEDVLGEKRTVDFWCSYATKKVSNTVVKTGKSVVKTGKSVGKTAVESGKTAGNIVIKSGMTLVEGGKAAFETKEKAMPENVVPESGAESLPAQEEPGNLSPIKLSPENSEDEAFDQANGDERFAEIYTAPSIDYTAESYRSQALFIAIWVAMVGTYFAYFFRHSNSVGRLNCETWDTADEGVEVAASFFCRVANAVISWIIIFLQLSIFGSLFIFLGSFGLTAGSSVWALLIGITSIAIFTVFAYFYDLDSPFYSSIQAPGWGFMYRISLGLGLVALFLQCLLVLRAILPKTFPSWFRRATVAMTNGMVRKEMRTKKATVFKIARLVDNALELQQEQVAGLEASVAGGIAKSASGTAATFLSSTGRALLNYQAQEHKKETSGGVWWAWKRLMQESILVEEGIWLHGRLVASNFFQLIVAFTIFLAIRFALNSFEFEVDEVDDDVVNEFVPEQWQIQLSVSVGAIAGFADAMSVAAMFIPSFISTTLRFRFGIIPSLGNSTFQQYREAVDLVAMMFGSMFWGCLVTALLCMVVFGAVTFLFAYQITRPTAAWVAAQLIGFSVTIGIKALCLGCLRKRFHGGFYRLRVAPSNFLALILECWYLGLSSGYMLVRSIILVSVSAIYVGRIDTPVLADGVGNLGSVALDSYPISFRKDILLHEAHRHPYIERLGTMYLMKVRYGGEFATRAGAMWRLLFVLALFPWLRKHRFPQDPSIPDELDIVMEEGEGALMDPDSDLDDDYFDAKYFDTTEQEVEIQNVTEGQVDHGERDRVALVLSGLAFQQPGYEEVPLTTHESNEVQNKVRFVDHSGSVPAPRTPAPRTPKRRASLADLKVQGSASHSREALMRLENEALKQQNRRLLEQVQALRRQPMESEFDPRQSSFMSRRFSGREHS